MPTISMFYGILVAMFYEDNDRHHLPHIHVRYSGMKAAIAIEDGRVLGKLGSSSQHDGLRCASPILQRGGLRVGLE